jgi:glycosyltransferase involved in cell wall biosynthesis
LVIDGDSTDDTVGIALNAGARVISHPGALLGARRRGFLESRGAVIVLLDSDQVLRPNALQRACDAISDGAAMVVLGERVWSPRTIVDLLSDMDKRLLEFDITAQLDPRRGVFLPRVFRRDVLAAGFNAIPTSIDDQCIARDHAIIYWECFKANDSVRFLPDCVWHIEPAGVASLWRKEYRWGWSTRELVSTGMYSDLIRDKTRRREINRRAPVRLRLASLGFLSLKAPAYFAGYFLGHHTFVSSKTS